jgi:hypothetical protein
LRFLRLVKERQRETDYDTNSGFFCQNPVGFKNDIKFFFRMQTQTLQKIHPKRRLSPISLSLVAFVVGTVAGLGAILFRGLIALLHNLFFLGKFSFFL